MREQREIVDKFFEFKVLMKMASNAAFIHAGFRDEEQKLSLV